MAKKVTKQVQRIHDLFEIANAENEFFTAAFAVNIKEKENAGIIIDIFSVEGPLIDTVEYDSEDILGDGEAGEA